MQLTQEQIDIITEIKSGEAPIIRINAGAGTGKTSTMLQAIQDSYSRYTRICVVSFNKDIATEIEDKLKAMGIKADSKTFHSIGLGACRKHTRKLKVDFQKSYKIAQTVAANHYYSGENKKYSFNALAKAIRLCCSSARNEGISPDRVYLPQNCFQYLDEENGLTEETLLITLEESLQLCIDEFVENKTLDFDDMIWLPMQLKLYPWSYDLVVVDESQDLNKCQIFLASTMRKKNGRLAFVGDENQAIYAWRGAHDAMNALDKYASTNALVTCAEKYKLTKTFRCRKQIVEIANDWVEDYHCGIEGDAEVLETDFGSFQDYEEYILENAKAGDFVISRTNKPNITLFFSFLNKGVPVTLRGYDFAKRIKAFVALTEKHNCSPAALVERTIHKIKKEIKDDAIQAEMIDEITATETALQHLFPDQTTFDIDEVEKRVKKIFGDESVKKDRVTLMTAHRSKGLEANRVFLLESTFSRKGDEEQNCWYVAVTRARFYLNRIFVEE